MRYNHIKDKKTSKEIFLLFSKYGSMTLAFITVFFFFMKILFL